MKSSMLTSLEQELSGNPCPKCQSPALNIIEAQELIENFAQLAEYSNADVEMISVETEEGQMLKKSFGGIAAILRFKLQN
jgi:peptide chain release factor subunit 1